VESVSTDEKREQVREYVENHPDAAGIPTVLLLDIGCLS